MKLLGGTGTIITTGSTEAFKSIHDRIPLILERDQIETWERMFRNPLPFQLIVANDMLDVMKVSSAKAATVSTRNYLHNSPMFVIH